MYALHLQEVNACLIPFINKSKSQFRCKAQVWVNSFWSSLLPVTKVKDPDWAKNTIRGQILGCPSKVKSHKFLVTPAKLIPQILGYPGKIDPSGHTIWTVHILSYCTVWVAMHCTCLLSPPWAAWNIAHGTAKSANMNYKCKTTWGRGVMSTTER